MVGADPGVGNERTALSWQRTALSLVAGSAILTRMTFDRLGTAALVSVMVAAPLALWVFLESRGRYRRDAEVIRRPRGGRAPLTLTVATVAIGCTELAALVLV